MKTFNYLQILFVALITSSCQVENPIPATPNSPENSFSIGSVDFETPHAYLFYGYSPSYRDGFMIALTNAPIIQVSPVVGTAVQNTMTHGVVLFVRNSPAYFATEQDVNITISTHTLDKNNAMALTNLTGFTDTFIDSGFTYGQPNESLATVYAIEGSGNGTITINTITIDYAARTGTVDCDYELTSDSGDVITGNYSGTFEIRNGS